MLIKINPYIFLHLHIYNSYRVSAAYYTKSLVLVLGGATLTRTSHTHRGGVVSCKQPFASTPVTVEIHLPLLWELPHLGRILLIHLPLWSTYVCKKSTLDGFIYLFISISLYRSYLSWSVSSALESQPLSSYLLPSHPTVALASHTT